MANELEAPVTTEELPKAVDDAAAKVEAAIPATPEPEKEFLKEAVALMEGISSKLDTMLSELAKAPEKVEQVVDAPITPVVTAEPPAVPMVKKRKAFGWI